MLFEYVAINTNNEAREGTVDAANVESAIAEVEKRGYTIKNIVAVEEKSSIFDIQLEFFQTISRKDIVIFSKQIAVLFESQVSALRIFTLLAAESDNPPFKRVLEQIGEDLRGGASISRAFSAHPDVFSNFYISMIKSGEESGTLEKSFSYLADYIDRSYQTRSKVIGAFIYPCVVIVIFILIMMGMMIFIIPQLIPIIEQVGQDIPIYTKIVIGISNVLVSGLHWLVMLVAAVGFGIWRFLQTSVGRRTLDEVQIALPFFGNLTRLLFLSRICDNLSTLLVSGVSMTRSLEITADVIDNQIYKEIVTSVLLEVKSGRSFGEVIAEYPEIPGTLSQMAKVGDESGNLGAILGTLAKFYTREVNQAVDTLISLIEPAMIVILGLSVVVLLLSVLQPIFNLSSAF